MKGSIFLKLLGMFLLAGFAVNIVLLESRRIFFFPPREIDRLVEKSFKTYFSTLIQEIEADPTPSTLAKMKTDLGFDIVFEKAGMTLSSSPDLPLPSRVGECRENREGRGPPGFSLFCKWERRGFFKIDVGDAHALFFPPPHAALGFRNSYFVIVLLCISAIIAALFWGIKRLFNPLQSLMEGVKNNASGNFEHSIPEKGSYELKILAKSFNAMTKKIKSMMESKDQLLFDISHELRSPLARIRVAAELPSESSRKGQILRNIELMDNLMETILRGTFIASFGNALHVEQVNLAELVGEAIEYFKGLRPGIVANFERDSSLFAEVDRRCWDSMVRNILDNALKYSDHQTKPVEVELTTINKDIQMVVRDFGKGMPKEEINRIFDPFYRIDKSRSEVQGFGMGLSICKRIVEAHGATIEVESVEGKGSVFVVRVSRTGKATIMPLTLES